jgi:hypothetical protein
MNYLVCESCRYETREVSDRCKKCETPYVCEWDASWYNNSLSRASMGLSRQAREIADLYIWAVLAFLSYAFFKYASGGASRDDWGHFFVLSTFLIFCTYEVWAFTRGRTTSIDSASHEALPKNTGIRVFGLFLDVSFSLFFAYWIFSE